MIPRDSIIFDCGRCIFCRKKKSLELARRCVLHSSNYNDNCFLTLTYDEKQEGYTPEASYRDIQLFKKRLRKHVQTKYNKKIEIFNVLEFGKNKKKHFHLIVFNYCPTDLEIFSAKNSINIYTSQQLSKLWTYGYHTIGNVSIASALYQSQYMDKDTKNGNTLSQYKSKSYHSGIGKPYFLKNYKQILLLGYIPFQNQKMPIPRYFLKIADKHYSHFYNPIKFEDTTERKKIYTPFKKGEENHQIALCYKVYLQTHYLENQKLMLENTELLFEDINKSSSPDFIKSGENFLYDLSNSTKYNKF